MPLNLFIGSGPSVRNALIKWACTLLSVEPGSSTAGLVCQRLHPLIRYLEPLKNGYKRSDFDAIWSEALRARDVSEPLLCIIEQIDALNTACANSLLKLLEEPPREFFFAGTACALEQVLPTISSRSVIIRCHQEYEVRNHEDTLFQLICSVDRHTPFEWLSALEKAELDDVRTRLVLDAAFDRLQCRFKEAVAEGGQQNVVPIERRIKIISYSFDRLPLPGSVALFWRNFILMVSA